MRLADIQQAQKEALEALLAGAHDLPWDTKMVAVKTAAFSPFDLSYRGDDVAEQLGEICGRLQHYHRVGGAFARLTLLVEEFTN